ncbi:unnamed protein product [Protopolystoma xenopodis]|uniref:Ig-like domain-containing protein n=1 Tax=Protopolystoma xenopodis TaxID=117903 RepID=A0A3S5CH75_9PLAT|nr:unnamed protein product [Protopolystoma xenopodis]
MSRLSAGQMMYPSGPVRGPFRGALLPNYHQIAGVANRLTPPSRPSASSVSSGSLASATRSPPPASNGQITQTRPVASSLNATHHFLFDPRRQHTSPWLPGPSSVDPTSLGRRPLQPVRLPYPSPLSISLPMLSGQPPAPPRYPTTMPPLTVGLSQSSASSSSSHSNNNTHSMLSSGDSSRQPNRASRYQEAVEPSASANNLSYSARLPPDAQMPNSGSSRQILRHQMLTTLSPEDDSEGESDRESEPESDIEDGGYDQSASNEAEEEARGPNSNREYYPDSEHHGSSEREPESEEDTEDYYRGQRRPDEASTEQDQYTMREEETHTTNQPPDRPYPAPLPSHTSPLSPPNMHIPTQTQPDSPIAPITRTLPNFMSYARSNQPALPSHGLQVPPGGPYHLEQAGRLGSPEMLNCTIRLPELPGILVYPHMRYAWLDRRGRLIGHSKTHVIDRLRWSDAGVYTCQVSSINPYTQQEMMAFMRVRLRVFSK